jgi:hypothetical protein
MPQQALPAHPPQVTYIKPLKDRSIALILEVLPGLFGILGIGWIYAGDTNTGLLWLIGYLVAAVVFVIADVLSGGLCCLVTVPLQIVAIVLSTTRLREYMATRPDVFGPQQ